MASGVLNKNWFPVSCNSVHMWQILFCHHWGCQWPLGQLLTPCPAQELILSYFIPDAGYCA